MILFILKGILRDKGRSLLPIIIITIGVALTVLLSGYMDGVSEDIIDQNARFQTGHLKVMSRSYAEHQHQIPNDLALLETSPLVKQLNADYPDYEWTRRIHFMGFMDADKSTDSVPLQMPVSGMAIDFNSNQQNDSKRLNIEKSLVKGNIPSHPFETIIGYELAKSLNLDINDTVTLLCTDMNGSMSFQNFSVSGTINYGAKSMNSRGMIIGLKTAQDILSMEDGTGEILGFKRLNFYDDIEAQEIKNSFNKQYSSSDDEYSPIMFTLKEQNNMDYYIDQASSFQDVFVFSFILIMSIVLWNTGLMGGLRRYGEYGLRMAMGESQTHIYVLTIIEACLIGLIGSVIGTLIGLGGVLYLQYYGIDMSGMIKESNILMPGVLRAKFSIPLLYIGFIPGLLAVILGNLLSGYSIYKRKSAQLIKELEL